MVPYVVVYVLVSGTTKLRFDQIVSDVNLGIHCMNLKSNHRKTHYREKLKNVLVRKPGRKSYYFSPILS